jgi:inward rectifier potassium channel
MTEPSRSGRSPKAYPVKPPPGHVGPAGSAPPNFLKVGVARYDWRDPYHFALTLSWPAFAGAALTGILLINTVFALLYLAVPGAVQNMRHGDVFMAFFFSVETLATVGYGEMAPNGLYGHTVAAGEIVLGMAFTAVMTGLVFVRFSRPKAKFLFADHLVIASHNGRRTLMLRMANARLSTMTSARASLGLVLREVTQEGRAFQGVHDLPLVRSEIPVFPMAWTIMHVIDASSPLHGVSLAQLEGMEARFFVAVEGRDTALQAVVQDMRTYAHAEIAHGMRYADMITHDEAGQPTADLSMISALEANA